MTFHSNETYVLTEDVLSGSRARSGKVVPYAKAGETVTVIQVSGETAVVSDRIGTRFPVSVSKLKKVEIED